MTIDDVLNERKSEFQILKDNKVKLTDEERAEVMKSKAVWHSGPHGEEQAAVWKSRKKDGSFVYVCHTHRAYQKKNTLKAAISIFHSFIKSTV